MKKGCVVKDKKLRGVKPGRVGGAVGRYRLVSV